MRAVVYTRYGPPGVLRLQEVEKPVPGEAEILVKVHATTVNRTDNATIRGIPFFAKLVTGVLKPKYPIPGSEFAGEVEAVGSKVVTLKPGDRVFGFKDIGAGSQAQYLVVQADHAVTIPEGISFEQAVAGTEGAHYALNFINKVNLQPGQKVLVNGASGAIGSAMVQLLRHFEIDVTAVCGTESIEQVKALGAGRVIDYQQQDFTRDTSQYNYVFDTVGKSSFIKCWGLLKPGGVYISSDLGYLSQNMFLPMITSLIKPLLGNRRTAFPFPVDIPATLVLVKQLIEQGKFRPMIDRTYPLEQIVEAYEYVGKGHKKGNVVVTVAH